MKFEDKYGWRIGASFENALANITIAPLNDANNIMDESVASNGFVVANAMELPRNQVPFTQQYK